jgi:hypothetical protein
MVSLCGMEVEQEVEEKEVESQGSLASRSIDVLLARKPYG